MKKMRMFLAVTLALILSVGMTVSAIAAEERITFPNQEEAAKFLRHNTNNWRMIVNDNGTVTAVRITANSVQPTQQETSQTGFPDGSFEEYAEEIILLVNIEREKAGLSPLTVNPLLMEAAGIRAGELSRLYSHTRPDEQKWSTVFPEVGYKHNGAAENIARRAKTPQQQVNSWMNSEGHRKNILGSYTEIGVAVNESGVVQLFANPK